MCLFRLLTFENVFGQPRDWHRSRSRGFDGLFDGTLLDRLEATLIGHVSTNSRGMPNILDFNVHHIFGGESSRVCTTLKKVGVQRLAQLVL